ncbi:PadR family transcriptional regulator [Agrococcus jejuensis]|uniref:DNA-binding transcriptional regulator, PadR family n=1 Tax=Agrococcus jejuensis TaxID=399736 RepID=A0A1G8BHN3_9MICO|nr:PadR family transcriptional regulator [Agrococcus jejuensis]SDH32533.1 DNA-binding transcriptional regulator, PadR family [Agrococcus jejuensis]
MSPVFAHGALRLYLLALLAESPKHGYEVMQALERRFGGTYQPSAGTIYPRLSRLEEEGLVEKHADGRRTQYVITDAGRAHLAERQGELDALETEIGDSVRRLADEVRGGVRDAMRTLRADLAAAERDARSTRSSSRPASAPDPEPASSTPHGRSEPRADDRADLRAAVHEVDLAVTRMRAEVRTLVRGASVTAASAREVLAEVDAAAARIRAILGR